MENTQEFERIFAELLRLVGGFCELHCSLGASRIGEADSFAMRTRSDRTIMVRCVIYGMSTWLTHMKYLAQGFCSWLRLEGIALPAMSDGGSRLTEPQEFYFYRALDSQS